MLLILAAAAALTCQPNASRRELPAQGRDASAFLPKGWIVEARQAFDLNHDGTPDLVLVIRQPEDEGRKLIAALATPRGFRNVGEATLPGYSLGDSNLEFNARGILVVTDLSGGTTANQTVMRYRYEGPDAATGAMRLIGMDIGNYSRTNQHDSTTFSFNYLTGGYEKRVDRLTRRGDYAPAKPVRRGGPPQCLAMADTPDPESVVMEEFERAAPR